MSDNIPFEIQTEIIKRVLDVKSLIQFRSVSKPRLSFIDSSEFIAGYRARKTQPHTLLLRYIDDSHEVKYLSVNSDTFKVQQDLAPNVTDLMKQFDDLRVIGYSLGLWCLKAHEKGVLVIWNPSIRRSVGILESGCSVVFGFAVCPVTSEPTVVKITYPWKVEIFTLSSKRWTEIHSHKPRKSIGLTHLGSHVVIGSCIYRVAYETIRLPDDYFTQQYMIVSFDLIAKEFKAIDLPDKRTTPFPVRFILSKLKGSLVVITLHREVKLWKMEPDCSFTQLFTINKPDSYISNIVGFRKNGELVVKTEERGGQLGFSGEAMESALKVYDPCSQHIKSLGFSGQKCSFFISSYKETLLLLDHSDSCVYPKINLLQR